VLIVGLGLTGCPTTPDVEPDPVLTVADDPGSSLAVALAVTQTEDDILSRSYLYTRIAEAYRETGNELAATQVLARITAIATEDRAGVARAEILAQTAAEYLRLDMVDEARRLIVEALHESRSLDDDFRSAVALQETINAVFVVEEELFDLLEEAVNQVYVVEDLVVRVDLLVDVARQYHDSGLGQQVDVLLQQAISAAVGIDSPWDRAAAYSGISLRSYRAGQQGQAETFAERALREIHEVEVVLRGPTEAARLLTVADDLYHVGYEDEAEEIILQEIEFPTVRIRGLLDQAWRRYESGAEDRALELLDAAMETAAETGSSLVIARAAAGVAERLVEFGEPQRAERNANAVRGLIEDVDDPTDRAELVEQLGGVYIRLHDMEAASTLADVVDNPGLRARVYAGFAEQAALAGSRDAAIRFIVGAAEIAGYPGAAAGHLGDQDEERLEGGGVNEAGAELEGADDTVNGEIARVAARMGEFRLALSIAARIDSPYAQAQALVAVGEYASAAGGLDRESRALLEEIRRDVAEPE